jgi:tripartite-type tricarboxylate transporter receptor subunit TctC
MISAVILSVVFLPLFSSWAQEDYPNKPIQIVVPFAAGGSLDLSTRILAEKLREYLGQLPNLTGIRFTPPQGPRSDFSIL